MQLGDSALVVWTTFSMLFTANQLSHAVYIGAEYDAVEQGDIPSCSTTS